MQLLNQLSYWGYAMRRLNGDRPKCKSSVSETASLSPGSVGTAGDCGEVDDFRLGLGGLGVLWGGGDHGLMDQQRQ